MFVKERISFCSVIERKDIKENPSIPIEDLIKFKEPLRILREIDFGLEENKISSKNKSWLYCFGYKCLEKTREDINTYGEILNGIVDSEERKRLFERQVKSINDEQFLKCVLIETNNIEESV